MGWLAQPYHRAGHAYFSDLPRLLADLSLFFRTEAGLSSSRLVKISRLECEIGLKEELSCYLVSCPEWRKRVYRFYRKIP